MRTGVWNPEWFLPNREGKYSPSNGVVMTVETRLAGCDILHERNLRNASN